MRNNGDLSYLSKPPSITRENEKIEQFAKKHEKEVYNAYI